MSLGHLKSVYTSFFSEGSLPAGRQAGLQGQYADTVMQMDFDN